MQLCYDPGRARRRRDLQAISEDAPGKADPVAEWRSGRATLPAHRQTREMQRRKIESLQPGRYNAFPKPPRTCIGIGHAQTDHRRPRRARGDSRLCGRVRSEVRTVGDPRRQAGRRRARHVRSDRRSDVADAAGDGGHAARATRASRSHDEAAWRACDRQRRQRSDLRQRRNGESRQALCRPGRPLPAGHCQSQRRPHDVRVQLQLERRRVDRQG